MKKGKIKSFAMGILFGVLIGIAEIFVISVLAGYLVERGVIPETGIPLGAGIAVVLGTTTAVLYCRTHCGGKRAQGVLIMTAALMGTMLLLHCVLFGPGGLHLLPGVLCTTLPALLFGILTRGKSRKYRY